MGLDLIKSAQNGLVRSAIERFIPRGLLGLLLRERRARAAGDQYEIKRLRGEIFALIDTIETPILSGMVATEEAILHAV